MIILGILIGNILISILLIWITVKLTKNITAGITLGGFISLALMLFLDTEINQDYSWIGYPSVILACIIAYFIFRNKKEATNLSEAQNRDSEKKNKFLELEKNGDQETIKFFKASWLTSRGNYYGQQKKYEQAKNDFNEAINLNHYHTPAYAGLGVLYREIGDFKEALRILKSAPEKIIFHGKDIYNQKFDVYNAITSVYLVMRNKKKALEYAEKALLELENPLKKEQDTIALKSGACSEKEQKEMINNLKELIVKLKKEGEIKKK